MSGPLTRARHNGAMGLAITLNTSTAPTAVHVFWRLDVPHGSFEVNALLTNPDLMRALFEKVHDIKSEPAKPGSPAYFVDVVSALQGAVVAAKAGPLKAIHTTSLRGAGPIIELSIRETSGVAPQQAVSAAKCLLEGMGFDLKGIVFQTRPAT